MDDQKISRILKSYLDHEIPNDTDPAQTLVQQLNTYHAARHQIRLDPEVRNACHTHRLRSHDLIVVVRMKRKRESAEVSLLSHLIGRWTGMSTLLMLGFWIQRIGALV